MAFLSALIQAPMLLGTSFLICHHEISLFTLLFAQAAVQCIVIAVLFWRKGLSLLDVQGDAHKEIVKHAAFGLTGSLLFFQSLKHLTPMVATLAMHTGLVILACLYRIIALEQLYFTATIFKLKGVIILIEFGAIPGLTVADMDQFNDDKFPETRYWVYLIIAIVSGFMLAVMSKVTHRVCREGLLRHEAYLSFYTALLTVLIMPTIIAEEYIRRRKEKPTERNWLFWLVCLSLIACVVVKTAIVDRKLNKRFVDDFDTELEVGDTPKTVQSFPEIPTPAPDFRPTPLYNDRIDRPTPI